MNTFRALLLSLLLLPTIVLAQDAADRKNSVIGNLFGNHNSSVLCLNNNSSIAEIRKIVDQRLLNDKREVSTSDNDIARAVYASFPCPFSPYRSELRPAKANDIEGAWLFPKESQKLRFGPKSPNWARYVSTPIVCEAVAYYPGGEHRIIQFSGKISCPISSANDVEIGRKNPQVASWKVRPNGFIDIARTDVQGHVEEWETFLVTHTFDFNGVRFHEGDLVQYLRRENGNDFFVATVFRHLVRLQ